MVSRIASIDGVDAAQVVDHVAEVVLRAGADLRHASAMQLAGAFEQRRHRVLQHHQALLQFIQLLDVLARRALGEDPLLDGFQFDLEAHR